MEVSQAATYSNISVSGVTVNGENAGGVFGKVHGVGTGGPELYYEHITVEGDIKGGLAGGIVGSHSFSYGGTLSISSVSFLGDVESIQSANISAAGGLIGEIDPGYGVSLSINRLLRILV